MIAGQVIRNPDGGLEAWVAARVLSAYGDLQQCSVIVDTGFTGWLTLPSADIRRLGLISAGYRRSITASGEAESFAYYETWVLWHGLLRWAEILESIDQPLLGMELMEGSQITVDASDGGEVVIEETRLPLPPA